MRTVGMLLLFCACSGAGFCAAHRLRKEAAHTEQLAVLLGEFMTYIRYQCLPLEELLRLFAAHPNYEAFTFLKASSEGFCTAQPPDVLWREAVTADEAVVPPAKEILCTLGNTLGTTDAEGQLAALALHRNQMEALAADMKEGCHKKGTLYCQLGVLAGAMLALLLL